VPLLTGAATEPDRPSYASLGVPLFPDASVQTAVTNETWTYARNAPAEENDDKNADRRFHPVAPGSEFLFDRRVDPGENVNLLTREPTEAGRMRDLLENHLTQEGAGVVERGVRIDPGIADRLRAMGYLQ
jgi:hypothetical protein